MPTWPHWFPTDVLLCFLLFLFFVGPIPAYCPPFHCWKRCWKWLYCNYLCLSVCPCFVFFLSFFLQYFPTVPACSRPNLVRCCIITVLLFSAQSSWQNGVIPVWAVMYRLYLLPLFLLFSSPLSLSLSPSLIIILVTRPTLVSNSTPTFAPTVNYLPPLAIIYPPLPPIAHLGPPPPWCSVSPLTLFLPHSRGNDTSRLIVRTSLLSPLTLSTCLMCPRSCPELSSLMYITGLTWQHLMPCILYTARHASFADGRQFSDMWSYDARWHISVQRCRFSCSWSKQNKAKKEKGGGGGGRRRRKKS